MTEGPADAGLLRVEMSPWDAHRLLGGMPIQEIANADVPMEDLLGPWASRMLYRLQDASGDRDRLIHLHAALAEHLRHGPGPDPEVLYVWRRIRASGGRVAVGELAEAVGWTRRHLTRKFTQQVGLPPKTVARIRRLHIALELLGTRAEIAMRDLAVQAGYSDQPHLVREMRTLTGSTPSRMLRYLSRVGADADQLGMSHSFKTPPAPAN
jgi:AraC-like DNA-binding protein